MKRHWRYRTRLVMEEVKEDIYAILAMLSTASGSMLKPSRIMKRHWRYHERLVIEAAKDNVFAGLAMLSASSGSMISREIGDKGGERNHLGNLDSSYYGEGVNDEAIK